MEQCKTCLFREPTGVLICCHCARLSFAVRELVKSIPLIGEYIPDYECENYLAEPSKGDDDST